MKNDNRITVITGCTGSGKSSLVYELCNTFDFEVIGADAFQIYKGLDIGTAKPDILTRSKIRHYQFDIVDPDQYYSAGRYVRDTESIIDKSISEGKIPIIVGGTGLYIKLLQDGLFDVDIQESYRNEVENIVETRGLEYLYNLLLEVDPITAMRLHCNDKGRISRAMEIYLALGIPLSKAHKLYHRPAKYSYDILVLDTPRDMLYSRINERVLDMLSYGWIDEVQSLIEKGYNSSTPGFRAIGYTDIYDFIVSKSNYSDLINTISQKTRNYAKRQNTFFKGLSDKYFFDNESIKKFILKKYMGY